MNFFSLFKRQIIYSLKSNILTKDFQKELFQAVDYFKMYKGNNRDSDIVFIKKIK